MIWHIYCKLIPVLTGSHILGRLEQPVVQLHNLSEQVQNLFEQVQNLSKQVHAIFTPVHTGAEPV